MKLYIFLGLLLIGLNTYSQETAKVYGRVKSDDGKYLPLVNIAIESGSHGTVSNDDGSYTLKLPIHKRVQLGFSFVGYKTVWKKIYLQNTEDFRLDITLRKVSEQLVTVKVEDKYVRNTNLVRLDPKVVDNVVNPTDRVIAIIKTQPGVIATNELSTQYSVRGGNFDENLIYVNDIEIYRPFLVHSGQQEGLSFVNSDMVSSILFSSGGFEAKYGDKMSSVLDIKYRTPTSFHAAFSGSLLGSSVYIEDATDNSRFSYLMGLRYKTNQYLLNSLETKGDYKPHFIDWQGMFNFQLSEKLTLSVLGDYSNNNYRFVPQTRETDFGTVMDAKRLTIYFEGQEADKYLVYFGSGSLTYKPNKNTNIKLIATAFNSIESEKYDILGEYWIGKVSTDFGSENYDKVIRTEGIGAYLKHARNTLNIDVKRLRLIGRSQLANSFLQWGIRYQNEQIKDRINEWKMIDSAGFSLPHAPDSVGYTRPDMQADIPLQMSERIFSDYRLNTYRLTAFVQNTWGVNESIHGFSFTLGARTHYWSSNEQLLLSPRASISYKPGWKRDIVFRLSGGMYYQPPFYRELKNLQGELNPQLKAQASAQIVLGSDYNFKIWKRDFKLVSELYYKYFSHLTPYTLDNVRIRYYADQQSVGYAEGIDLKINGEFVKGIESWASLSVLRSREDIEGDFRIIDDNSVEVKYLPRPTDRLVSVSIFFQDYLPVNPTYSVSLMGSFASGTPFGPPNSPKYNQTIRALPYQRVDIGFSKEIVGEQSRKYQKGFFKHFKSLSITAEVLNLFNNHNTSGYIWVTDVTGAQLPVPNYLTLRQFNLRLVGNF
jgi:hypothetical protein